jgi:hypothetical protein
LETDISRRIELLSNIGGKKVVHSKLNDAMSEKLNTASINNKITELKKPSGNRTTYIIK